MNRSKYFRVREEKKDPGNGKTMFKDIPREDKRLQSKREERTEALIVQAHQKDQLLLIELRLSRVGLGGISAALIVLEMEEDESRWQGVAEVGGERQSICWLSCKEEQGMWGGVGLEESGCV